MCRNLPLGEDLEVDVSAEDSSGIGAWNRRLN